MSIQPPRIEARVTAQERLQTILHARIEELSEDMLSSFGAQALYQGRIEQKIDALSDKIETEIGAVKTEMAAMESRMQGNIAALEKQVLNAFQQLLTIIDQRLPPLEK